MITYSKNNRLLSAFWKVKSNTIILGDEMDKVIAVLCIVVVLAIIVSGEIYLKMDKNKSLALLFLKKMDGGLKKWLSIADKLFALEETDANAREQYSRLISEYNGIKRKHSYKKVNVICQIYDLVKSVISENASNAEISELGRDFTLAFLDFSHLQAEYNACTSKLNTALGKTISGAIGKVMRVRPLDTLPELAVL